MDVNSLRLNADKIKVLVFGNLSNWPTSWWPECLGPCTMPGDKARNLGVIFDVNLTFEPYVNKLTFCPFKDAKEDCPFCSMFFLENISAGTHYWSPSLSYWLGVTPKTWTRCKPNCRICCYLFLAQQGFAVGIVKGYLSALSAFLRLPDQLALFKSPVVMCFLKSLVHVSP